MGSTRDFFAAKKEWSFFKDAILERYLVPYTYKITSTNRPLIIVDCFAGKGKFDSGDSGSPLIIAHGIEAFLGKKPDKRVRALFIEKKYAQELIQNCSGYRYCEIKKGTFEEHIDTIIRNSSQSNIFLYVDPYGIKSLDFTYFERIKKRGFNTLELLVNFNTFGFLREGCRIMKEDGLMDAFADETSNYEIDDNDDINTMNRIAGGEYWQEILREYRDGIIGAKEAENRYTLSYTNVMRRLFAHVINIPITLKTEMMPNYRLIFGTNSFHGLFLMVDLMSKIWREIAEISSDGQRYLFDFNVTSRELLDDSILENDIISTIGERGVSVLATYVTSKLIEKYGITFSTSDYKKKYKAMDGKLIKIHRSPEVTPTGKKSSSMDWDVIDIYLERI